MRELTINNIIIQERNNGMKEFDDSIDAEDLVHNEMLLAHFGSSKFRDVKSKIKR